MNWVTAAMLAGYIGICEYRAPSPWVACESRWNWALGVLVPSPIQGALPAAGRLLGMGRRRRSDANPEEPKP
jgi:hypothetical protein